MINIFLKLNIIIRAHKNGQNFIEVPQNLQKLKFWLIIPYITIK